MRVFYPTTELPVHNIRFSSNMVELTARSLLIQYKASIRSIINSIFCVNILRFIHSKISIFFIYIIHLMHFRIFKFSLALLYTFLFFFYINIFLCIFLFVLHIDDAVDELLIKSDNGEGLRGNLSFF